MLQESQASVSTTSLSSENSIESECSLLIEKILGKSPSKKKLRFFASRVGMHPKTLERILNGTHRPSFPTVYNLWSHYFGSKNMADWIHQCPSAVKDALGKINAKIPQKTVGINNQAQTWLCDDTVASQIFVLLGSGPMTSNVIEKKYGEYGSAVLVKMEKLKLVFKSGNTYQLVDENIFLDTKSTFEIGLTTVKTFAKPDNLEHTGQNHLGFYADGLSQETYKEWLKLDHECYLKKISLLKKSKSKGEIRAFTFSITDTLTETLTGKHL